MTNNDNSIRGAEAYDTAFRIGVVGTVVLTIAALLGDTLAALIALAIWSMVVLFILPFAYVWFSHKLGQLPGWAIKGPHQ